MLDIGIIIYSLMKFIFLVILNQTLLTFRIKRNNILENSKFRNFFLKKKLNSIGHFFKIQTKFNNWKLSLFNRILIICYFQRQKNSHGRDNCRENDRSNEMMAARRVTTA